MDAKTAEYREIGRLALLREYDGLLAALNVYFKEPDTLKEKRRVSGYPLMARAMQESPQVRAFSRGGRSSKSAQHSASRPRKAKKPTSRR